MILISVLLLAAAVFWLVTLLGAESGDYVTVSVDGELKWTLPLDEDTVMRIDRGDGDYNILVIKDGMAWVSEASCPDLKCVHMKKISRDGECIICLPNRLVIQAHSSEKPKVDSITE